jgi:RNA polymerase sigma-70 factor (ECF subfamily)
MREPLDQPEALIRQVYSYVAYRIGVGAEAEDVTGETFERAVRYRSSFDGCKGTPLVWLLGISRNVLAGRHGAVPVDTAEPEGESEGFEDAVVARLDLDTALACLTGRERELIALRYGADLSSKQIGELLEVDPGTVDVALHRARARVRGLLRETVEM